MRLKKKGLRDGGSRERERGRFNGDLDFPMLVSFRGKGFERLQKY